MFSFMSGVFNSNPPPKQSNIPKWDISVVLEFLKSPRFEPLGSVSFKRCKQKFLFLLLLASGRRIGDMAALTREFYVIDNRVVLKWVEGYRAKNDRQDFCPEDPSIVSLESDDLSEKLLCPVRALNIFWVKGVRSLDLITI